MENNIINPENEWWQQLIIRRSRVESVISNVLKETTGDVEKVFELMPNIPTGVVIIMPNTTMYMPSATVLDIIEHNIVSGSLSIYQDCNYIYHCTIQMYDKKHTITSNAKDIVASLYRAFLKEYNVTLWLGTINPEKLPHYICVIGYVKEAYDFIVLNKETYNEEGYTLIAFIVPDYTWENNKIWLDKHLASGSTFLFVSSIDKIAHKHVYGREVQYITEYVNEFKCHNGCFYETYDIEQPPDSYNVVHRKVVFFRNEDCDAHITKLGITI